MWKLLFYVKADQTGWEPSYAVDQVLLPLMRAKPVLPDEVLDVAVQCKRSEADHYRRQLDKDGSEPWVVVGRYWLGTRRFHLKQVESLHDSANMEACTVRAFGGAPAIEEFVTWSLGGV